MLKLDSYKDAMQVHPDARQETSRTMPILSAATSQKWQQQQDTKKCAHAVVPSSLYAVASKPSVLPIGATQWTTPTLQVQVSLLISGPSPQVQSHEVATSTVNKTATLPVGNIRREIHLPIQSRRNVRVLVSSPPTAIPPKSSALLVGSMPGPAPYQEFGQYSKGIASLDSYEVQSVKILSSSYGIVERETSQNGLSDCAFVHGLVSTETVNKKKMSEMDDNSQHQVTELPDGDVISVMLWEQKLKSSMQTTTEKNNVQKGIKQRKEISRTSDSVDNSFTVDYQQVSADVPYKKIRRFLQVIMERLKLI